MFGNQRQAAPWSDHHWWGQYDDPSQLPNVAGAKLQLGEDVQAGDMAWSLSDGRLYVCTVPTIGAAVWESVSAAPSPPADPLHLYVAADAATANDSGPGSIAEPLATLDEALRRTNLLRIVLAPVVIHMAPAAAGYEWNEILGPLQQFHPIVIYGDGAGQGGDGFAVLQAPKPAAAGSSNTVVVDPDGGLTVNEFQGKTIEILTGAAAGDRRLVRNNTATNIVPVSPFSVAVASGDEFRIVEPAVLISAPGGPFNEGPYPPLATGTCGDMGELSPNPRLIYNPSSLGLINIRLVPDASGFDLRGFSSIRVMMYGVESESFLMGDRSSLVAAGCDQGLGGPTAFTAILPVLLGYASGAFSWRGWGLFATSVNMPPAIIGWLVTRNETLRTIFNYSTAVILGGGLDAPDRIDIRGGSVVFLGNSAIPTLISSRGTTAGVVIRSGAFVHLGQAVLIQKTNAGPGIMLVADNSGQGAAPSVLELGNTLTLEGIVDATSPGYAIQVSGGCVVGMRNQPVFTGTWLDNYAIRTTSTGTVIEAAASIAVNGEALPSVGVADGRYGWIRRVA